MLIAIAVVSLLTGGVAGACLTSTAIRACMRNGTYRWCDVKGRFLRVQRPSYSEHRERIELQLKASLDEKRLFRFEPQVLVCRGEEIEIAEALLGAACEGYVEPHAARETPIKTGSANVGAVHGGAKTP